VKTYWYSELSGSRSHVYSFLHYMFFFCEKNAFIWIATCKLVLEIFRKLQTRMPQLTIHQYTKTKAATIFVMQYKSQFIQSEEYGQVQRSNFRLSQYNLGLAFHTAYSCIFHPCNFARIAFSLPHFQSHREYDWRRRLCINFVVCYCVSYAVHDIVSGPKAPTTCSEYSFWCSCLNLCIICKQFTNVNCNSSDHKL